MKDVKQREKDKLNELEHFFNRFQLGMKSFDEPLYKHLGLSHTMRDMEMLTMDIEMSNIPSRQWSSDLIYGIPDQPMRGWRTCQVKMRMMDVGHASIYPFNKGEYSIWARLNRYKEQNFAPKDLLHERMYRENHE